MANTNKTRKSIPTQTAAEAYAVAQKKVTRLMVRVHEQLQAHAARQKNDPRNWGFAGDMNNYAEKLEQILGVEK